MPLIVVNSTRIKNIFLAPTWQMHTVVPRIIGLAPGTALPYGGLLTGLRQSLLVTQTRVAQQAQDGEGEGGDQCDHV